MSAEERVQPKRDPGAYDRLARRLGIDPEEHRRRMAESAVLRAARRVGRPGGEAALVEAAYKMVAGEEK